MSEIKNSYCLGGRHKSQNFDPKVTKKVNPRTKERVKIIKSKCSICGRHESQILTL